MINEDRFWEASIAEAVSDKPPPDITAKVLTELARGEPAPAKRGRVRLLRWGLELAAAAVVVLAIGLATGIISLPGGEDDTPLPPTQVAASPDAVYEYIDGNIELKHGWLLVTTGAPTVMCEGSVLSKVDGRVLIHAGSMPPGERPESVVNWLNANNVETDMVNNIKHWVKGVGLAALVLSGTAMLDGQEIKAPEPQPQSTAEWHVVRSVMDIDNLPEGAKYVNADGLDAAHLDFLAEVESLEGISLRSGVGLRSEHLVGLKVLKNLKWLDIRGVDWASMPDLAPLSELPSVKRLGIDLVPASFRDEDGKLNVYADGDPSAYELGLVTQYITETRTSYNEISFDYEESTLPALKALSERGVMIDLGTWRPGTQEDVADVLETLPTLNSIVMDYASTGVMKMLASHDKLTAIELENYSAGQLGLAYLARKSSLQELSISSEQITLEEVYQLSRMGLRFLRIDAELASSPDRCFEALSKMKNLRELELANLNLDDETYPAYTELGAIQRLDRLLIEYPNGWAEFMVAHVVPTRRLEIGGAEYATIPNMKGVPEALRNGQVGKHLEVIRFDLSEAEFSHDYYSEENVASLKSYPNLKRIEVRRGGFDTPAEEDQFVRWLKENLPDVEVVVTP